MTIPQQDTPKSPLMSQPFFLVDVNGNPLSLSTIAGNVNINQVLGATISSTNPVLSTLFDASGHQIVIDSSGRLTLVPNQVMEIGDGTTPTQKLAINASGQIALSNFPTNTDNVTLLASASHSTTQTIDNIVNANARGVMVCVDTTVNATSCSNVVTINAKDPVSGKVVTLLTGAAITGVGTVFYTIYPGATPATNLTVSLPLPKTYQVVVTAGNANAATYSVSASYIL